MFTSAIRSSQQLTVHQRLAVPPSVVDQSVVGGGGGNFVLGGCHVCRALCSPLVGLLHHKRRPGQQMRYPARAHPSHPRPLQERQLTWCCCFGQGLLRAHVRVERDEVQPGQEVAAILEVDNQARAAVKRVEVGAGVGAGSLC